MATSIIKLHTFSGAGDNQPPCFLLQVDDFYCLLDCGCLEDNPPSFAKELSKWVKMIDAVLISHPSMRHLGLLPVLVGKYGLKCPIYATTPVYKLGQLVLYDAYQSRYVSGDSSSFSLDDVDAAFELIVQVKYQQTINLQGRGHGLSVTPLPSGHMLGGTIWKLIKDETDIIYAIDFNHKKGRHLNGATFDACIRPRLLIIDVSNALYTHSRRKNREEALRQLLLRTLRRGGNVLIAVDTAGYCLEIAHLLETLWHIQDSGFMAYGLAMLTHVAYNVFDSAKSLVEWMSDKIVRTFEDQRSNPFHLRHLQLCHTLDELDFVPDPKVILASEPDLRSGFSRLLFTEWSDSDLNTVIVTSRNGDFRQVEDLSEFFSPVGLGLSLGRRLIGLANNESWARVGVPTGANGALMLPFTFSQRVVVECPPEASTADLSSSLNDSNFGILNDGKKTTAMPTSVATSVGNAKTTPFGRSRRISSFGGKDQQLYNDLNTLENVVDDDDDAYNDEDEDIGQTDLRRQLSSTSALVSENASHVAPSNTYQPYELTLSSTPTLTHGRHHAGYDIFPGAYNHSGGQFFRMTKRTQLVFPTVEKTVSWDEYGERVDPAVYKMSAEPFEVSTVDKRGKPPPRDISRLLSESAMDLSKGSDLPGQPAQFDIVSASQDQLLDLLVLQNSTSLIPGATLPNNFTTKCVVKKLELPLRCELSFIDYESRSDGEALKKIITGLRPQEVILVGGTNKAITHIAEHCQSVLMLKSDLIHVPQGLDVVNCTKEGDIYQARMKDSLVTGLKFTKIREYELAWVEADIAESDSPSSKKDESAQMDAEGELGAPAIRASVVSDSLPMLVPASNHVVQHDTVFVNEPKLSDLKQILLNLGMSAEFVSGVLVVDNCVAIKRSEAGRLLLEGMLCKVYYDVRAVLYRQFAIL
uniref:Cleavage and polyadenylation specificity factor subunit 2 n=1 Tax=Schistocephalus solidus TaxID=70667 RepID=A0A0X3NZP2_SCHSO